MLHRAHELAYVAHLVIVPAYHFDELGIAHGYHFGLGCVEERTVRDADDVGAHEFFFGIAKAFIGSGLHGSIHLFGSGFLCADGGQFGYGTGDGGHTLCSAVEFAFQFGQYQSDGFGSAGAVGHDVLGGSACAAQVTFGVGYDEINEFNSSV